MTVGGVVGVDLEDGVGANAIDKATGYHQKQVSKLTKKNRVERKN